MNRELPEPYLSTEAAALLLALKFHRWGVLELSLSQFGGQNIKPPQVLMLKKPFKEASCAIKCLGLRTACTTEKALDLLTLVKLGREIPGSTAVADNAALKTQNKLPAR